MDTFRSLSLLPRTKTGFAVLATLLCAGVSLPTAADNHPYRSEAERRDYEYRDDPRNYDRYERDRRERERRYRRGERDAYEYCRELAMDETGYRGAIPAEYQRGSKALEGALKGGASGAGTAWVLGGNKEQRKKAAKRAAGVGFLIGALKDAENRKKRERNERKRRRFQEELDRCMSSR